MTKEQAMHVASDMALNHRIPVVFVCFSTKAKDMIKSLLSQKTGISKETILSGNLSPSDFSAITEACGRYFEAPLYIVDERKGYRKSIQKFMSNNKVEVIFSENGLKIPEGVSFIKYE